MAEGRLGRLLSPRRIAFIGGRECGVAIEQCRRAGFAGVIEVVHPKREMLAGIPCKRSVGALDAPPDAAFVAVPPEATVDVVAELSAMGAGGAVCYAAGFKEAGAEGEALQVRVVEAAGAMPILGPNCYGLLNYLEGVTLWPDVHGGARVERGVAIVAQSSNMAINFTMQDRGLPIAHLATVGNAATVGPADLIEAHAADPRVSAIGVHLEGLPEGAARFARAVAVAHRAGKPVLAFKTGLSARGARATLSHTSSMAGGAAAFDAYLERLGVPRATSVPAFLETLKLLHVHGGLAGGRLVSMSCSGGEAALVADTAERVGVTLPDFDAPSRAALVAALGPGIAIDNPLDYHTYIWLDQAACEACYTAALSGPVDVGMLVLDYPKAGVGDETGWEMATDALIAAARTTGRPTMVVASLPECLPPAARARLMAAGIAPMQGIEEALIAVRAATLAGAGLARAGGLEAPDTLSAPRPVVLADGPGRSLDEYRAKRRLAAAGVAVPEGALVTSASEALAAAEAIGYPVVAKAVSAVMAHKSEHGAVRLGLADADALHEAVVDLLALSGHVLVERMVAAPVAELIVGVTRDPLVGPCLMIGAGGVLAEVLADRAILSLPADRAGIEAALRRLRVFPLLEGYRGRPAGDLPATLDAIQAIADFAVAQGDGLLELDVNPLIVGTQGTVAADAFMRIAEEREVA